MHSFRTGVRSLQRQTLATSTIHLASKESPDEIHHLFQPTFWRRGVQWFRKALDFSQAAAQREACTAGSGALAGNTDRRCTGLEHDFTSKFTTVGLWGREIERKWLKMKWILKNPDFRKCKKGINEEKSVFFWTNWWMNWFTGNLDLNGLAGVVRNGFAIYSNHLLRQNEENEARQRENHRWNGKMRHHMRFRLSK